MFTSLFVHPTTHFFHTPLVALNIVVVKEEQVVDCNNFGFSYSILRCKGNSPNQIRISLGNLYLQENRWSLSSIYISKYAKVSIASTTPIIFRDYYYSQSLDDMNLWHGDQFGEENDNLSLSRISSTTTHLLLLMGNQSQQTEEVAFRCVIF